MTPNQSIELREAIIRAIWFRFGSIARHGLDDPNLGKTADDILGLLHQPEKPSDLEPSDLRSSPAPSQGDVERIVAAFEADPFGDDLPTQGTTQQGARFEHYARLAIAAMPVSAGAFRLGDRVEETSGSAWHGIIVGTYSTSLTPEGYAVESEREPGSVQIYPAKALRLSNDDGKEGR